MPGRLLNLIGRRSPESTGDPSPLTMPQKSNSLPVSAEGPVRDHRTLSMDKVKRMHIGAKLGDKDKDRKHAKSLKAGAHLPANLTLNIESPPLVFHGSESDSSGALFSAQLQLFVVEPSVTFDCITAKIEAVCAVEKPVSKDCPDCSREILKLNDFDFAAEPLTLRHGQHSFPVSHLFKGHLPATTNSPLVKFDYVLTASARTTTGEKIDFHQPIPVKRAVPERDDHTSSRTFPPTDFMLHATYNRNVYPIGGAPFHFRLENLTKKHPNENFQIQFRMTSFVWRLEERHKMISPPCARHAHKHGEGKGVLNQELRILASDTMIKGWKSDLNGGTAEWEIPIATKKRAHCDVTAENGISVTHSLVVDMVLREERAPLGRPELATPTGLAKQCKTQFYVLMTERAGMGISWDEEMPPTYQDVPPSPPRYAATFGIEGAEVPRGEVSELLIGESTSSPMIRPSSSHSAGESSVSGATRGSPSTTSLATPPSLPARGLRPLDHFTEEDFL